MPAADAQAILEELNRVAAERERRAAQPALAAAVARVKQYQQRRFAHTYADLLDSERYAGAARFFLEELYGPRDFTERDEQFARVVPALVRLFPQEIIDTVHGLARLHALSEQLDTAMGSLLIGSDVDAHTYIPAWQGSGDAAARELQIALTLEIGASLDRLTRKPLLRSSLHLMRGPARAAGLADLQRFLESGFDTFRAMRGAQSFLDMVGARERRLARALFDAPVQAGDVTAAASDTTEARLTEALGQLP
jgi:hypothetical protein